MRDASLPLPAPTKQTECAEAGGKEGHSTGQRDGWWWRRRADSAGLAQETEGILTKPPLVFRATRIDPATTDHIPLTQMRLISELRLLPANTRNAPHR